MIITTYKKKGAKNGTNQKCFGENNDQKARNDKGRLCMVQEDDGIQTHRRERRKVERRTNKHDMRGLFEEVFPQTRKRSYQGEQTKVTKSQERSTRMTIKCEECGKSVEDGPFEYEGRAFYHEPCYYGKAVREYKDLLEEYRTTIKEDE